MILRQCTKFSVLALRARNVFSHQKILTTPAQCSSLYGHQISMRQRYHWQKHVDHDSGNSETNTDLPPLREHFQHRSNMAMEYWDYSFVYGPEKWHLHWKYGGNQSPIHIKRKETTFDHALTVDKLQFAETNPISLVLGNSGLNVACHPTDSNKIPFITDGPLTDKYEFKELHFHWGKTDDVGSEHVVGNRTYPAEAHLVHWNKSLYSDFETAKKSKNGLTVIGVFLDLSEKGDETMEKFTSAFKNVEYKNTKYHLDFPLNPYFIVPLHRLDYWTYPGSLTTPPCTENVTWILFRDPFPITHAQLRRFRNLKAVQEKDKNEASFHDPMGGKCSLCSNVPPTIGNNYRPTLPVNERSIRASFEED